MEPIKLKFATAQDGAASKSVLTCTSSSHETEISLGIHYTLIQSLGSHSPSELTQEKSPKSRRSLSLFAYLCIQKSLKLATTKIIQPHFRTSPQRSDPKPSDPTNWTAFCQEKIGSYCGWKKSHSIGKHPCRCWTSSITRYRTQQSHRMS